MKNNDFELAKEGFLKELSQQYDINARERMLAEQSFVEGWYSGVDAGVGKGTAIGYKAIDTVLPKTADK